MSDSANEATERALRTMLHARAEDVPPAAGPPAPMLRRARRRVVTTLAGTMAAVVLLAGVAVAGTRLLTTSAPQHVTHHPPGPQPSSSPAIGACASKDLRGSLVLSGAAGSRGGPIVLTDAGGTCTLRGRATLQLLDRSGTVLTVTVQRSSSQWQLDGAKPPTGWPVVTLRRGGRANLYFLWSNWCGGRVASARISWSGNALSIPVPADTPPCNGQTLPSTIELGPFEPAG